MSNQLGAEELRDLVTNRDTGDSKLEQNYKGVTGIASSLGVNVKKGLESEVPTLLHNSPLSFF